MESDEASCEVDSNDDNQDDVSNESPLRIECYTLDVNKNNLKEIQTVSS